MRRRQKQSRRRQPPVEVTIDQLGGRGDGVAHNGESMLFVAGVLPGETVRVEPGSSRGRGQSARLLEVLEPSPLRQAPPCPHVGRCGGCQVQHSAPSFYAEWKRGLAIDALLRQDFDEALVQPLESAPPESRRRVRFAIARKNQSHVPAFRQSRSHDTVAIETCLVADPSLMALARHASAVLGPLGAKEIEATQTITGIDLMVLAPEHPDLAGIDAVQSLAEAQDLARIVWRSPGHPPYAVTERRQPMLHSGGAEIVLPPGAFVQPTAWAEIRICDRLESLLGDARHVADLYAGCGVLGLSVAGGRRVEMFEADPAMAGAGRRGGELAGLSVQSAARDLDESPLGPNDLERFDAVILDPPRTGALAQCEQLAGSSVATVAYVSCHPGTFARDAAVLADSGYELMAVWPLDQFLWTHHLELVGHFVRR
tara:strand:+ start:31030 stop:32310 length:1281 start_codon:yes stop_codon:yes gene_type:complete